jgi:tape measure domain-containing protein
MTDIELRLTADVAQATKGVGAFSKQYRELVNAIEKPLKQVGAFRTLESSLESLEQQSRTARDRVRDLGNELARSSNPSKALTATYKDAVAELQRLTRAENLAQNQLASRRRELQSARIDTKNLAGEQKRLSAELNAAALAGRRDAATAGIRAQSAALGQLTREQRLSNIEQAKSSLGVSGYRQLQAELKRLTGQYQLLRTSGNLTTRELAVAQQTLTRRIRETNQALREASNSQARTGGGVGGAVAGVAGGFGVLEAARGFVTATDSAKKMEAQLKLATASQEEFNTAQTETFRIAQENQAPIADVVTLYSRLAPALRDVGKGQGETLKIIEAVTKSLRISGATAQETASTIQQFSQALGSGVLRGEEFNTLAESSPRLLRALADGLNVNVGALRAMAAEGKLTADVISSALIGQLPKLTQEAAQLPETFAGAATKFNNQLVGAITTLDKFTGASNTAIGSITRLSGVLSAVSNAKEPSWLDKFSQTFRALSDVNVTNSAFSFLLFGFKDAKKEADKEAQVYGYREGLFDLHRKEMQILRDQEISDDTKYIGELKKLQDDQVKAAEDQGKALVAAQEKANADLDKIKQDRLDIEKRYSSALTELGGVGDPSYGAAQALKVGARNALQAGDVEGAQAQARAALKTLQDLAAAGGNTFGFEGFIKELQAIDLAANDIEQTRAEDKITAIGVSMALLKEDAKKLENLPVSVEMDETSLEGVRALIQQLAQQIGSIEIILPVRAVVTGLPGGTDGPSDAGLGAPKFATGGKLRGPGTGTSDSILMWGSNGEFMQPASSVNYYGEAFMEAIRQRRIPKFAEGGSISERNLPAIPSMNPALAAGPSFPDLGRVAFEMGGESVNVYASPGDAMNIQRLARKFGSRK